MSLKRSRRLILIHYSHFYYKRRIYSTSPCVLFHLWYRAISFQNSSSRIHTGLGIGWDRMGPDFQAKLYIVLQFESMLSHPLYWCAIETEPETFFKEFRAGIDQQDTYIYIYIMNFFWTLVTSLADFASSTFFPPL